MKEPLSSHRSCIIGEHAELEICSIIGPSRLQYDGRKSTEQKLTKKLVSL